MNPCSLLSLGSLVILLELFSASRSTVFEAPPLQYDIIKAHFWKCFHSLEPDSIKQLIASSNQNGIEIIHTEGNWIEVISLATNEEDLKSMGLDTCYKIARISDLIDIEKEQSWESLKYHISQEANETTESGAHDNNTTRVGLGYFGTSMKLKHSSDRRLLRSAGDTAHTREEASVAKPFLFTHYLNLSSIKDWYEKLAVEHKSVVTLNHSIGKSFYDRDIFAVRFTDKGTLGTNDRPKIYLQCLLHSREWISGAVCMFIAEKLAKTNMFAGLLQNVEIVMVPVVNPDGYYVTWYKYPKYRLWRKNVSPVNGTKCAGVDLNRNFNSHWNMQSTSLSSDPCSELYSGHDADSELEVQAITSYLESLGTSVVGAIDFHSYHQEILYPPAWADENPGDIEVIKRVAESVANTTSRVGAMYTARRMFDIYSASGTFADWLLDWRGTEGRCSSLVPLTVELRPDVKHVNSTYSGFLLPPSSFPWSPPFHDLPRKVQQLLW